MTYTLARLVVPRSVHELIGRKLRTAGYHHAFHGDTIDMTHIGLEPEVGPPLRTGPLTASMDNVLASRLGAVFAAAAAETKIGDQIDRGLVLLRELHALGFVVTLAEHDDKPRSCGRPAVVEIRPLGDTSPDSYTHACAAHVVDMFGVRDGEPEPPAYEVRELAGEEVEGPPALVCCHITPPYAPEPDGILTTGAPAIGSAP